MEVNQQKIEQDLIRETEIEIDQMVNDKIDNKTQKDLNEEKEEKENSK